MTSWGTIGEGDLNCLQNLSGPWATLHPSRNSSNPFVLRYTAECQFMACLLMIQHSQKNSDRHQSLIDLSQQHAPPVQKICPKSILNLLRYLGQTAKITFPWHSQALSNGVARRWSQGGHRGSGDGSPVAGSRGSDIYKQFAVDRCFSTTVCCRDPSPVHPQKTLRICANPMTQHGQGRATWPWMTENGHFALNYVLRRYVLSSKAWLSKLGYS